MDEATRTGFILEGLFGDGVRDGIHSNQMTSPCIGAPDS